MNTPAIDSFVAYKAIKEAFVEILGSSFSEAMKAGVKEAVMEKLPSQEAMAEIISQSIKAGLYNSLPDKEYTEACIRDGVNSAFPDKETIKTAVECGVDYAFRSCDFEYAVRSAVEDSLP